jgi:DNA-binding MarR family transcriptional regulator
VAKEKQLLDWSFMYALQQTYVVMEKRLTDRLSKAQGITFSQFLILATLSNKTTNSQHAIAAELQLAEATLSRHVNALERAKYIARKGDPANRRKYIVVLTPKGARAYANARTIIRQELKGMFAMVPQKHCKDMSAVLERVREKLAHKV